MTQVYKKKQNLVFPQLFEAQVKQTPDAVAVVFEDKQLTYQELNCRANRLAYYLCSLGVGPEVLVGIYVERSIELAVAIVAILKVGGACVPLDPENSKARLAFILVDTQVPVLLTQQRFLDDLEEISNHKVKVHCLDTNWEVIAQDHTETPESGVTAEDLAFVFYTSGSTGKPKGVMIPHRAVCHRAVGKSNFQNQSDQQPTKVNRVLLSISISFVGLIGEVIRPLLTGDTVIIARPMGNRDSAYLVKLIVEQKITIVNFVPSMLQVFLEEPGIETCSSLKYVLCSGETLPIKLQERFFARLNADLHNIYGLTEAGGVTCWNCERENNQRIIPIGSPTDMSVYLLDHHLQPVPVGDVGDVYIGGAGLARGYLNRPKLTAEKFIPNPFSKELGERLLKTGDLARYLPDGNIEFLGRLDTQVKIRGFRIELGEIEAILSQHPSVQQTVVIDREDTRGDKQLVAYLVLTSSSSIVGDIKQPLDNSQVGETIQPQSKIPNQLRDFLKQKLPDYMIPSAFVMLESLTLTQNGKIDRRALPAPDKTRLKSEEIFVAPRDELELKLTKILEKVLGIQPIYIKDNFFDLGGHSLLAVKLFAQIEKTWQTNLPLANLFQSLTVENLAKVLRSQGELSPSDSDILESNLSPKMPVNSHSLSSEDYHALIFSSTHWKGRRLGRKHLLLEAQPGDSNSKPPLFFIGPETSLCQHLDSAQPVYIMPGGAPTKNSETYIKAIATCYVEEIQKFYPKGPYLLCGYCFGGLVAFEIAQQLQAQAEEVALLTLVDTILNRPHSISSRYLSILFKFERWSYSIQRIIVRP